MVGVAGRGAITTPTARCWQAPHAEDVVKAMDKVLPRPIDHFLLQADLTVVVPGPLERDLAEQLGAVARSSRRARPWCTASAKRPSGGPSIPAGPQSSCTRSSRDTPKPLCHRDSPT